MRAPTRPNYRILVRHKPPKPELVAALMLIFFVSVWVALGAAASTAGLPSEVGTPPPEQATSTGTTFHN